MKIRHGFVSNSSSTELYGSLPAAFDWDKEMKWDKVWDKVSTYAIEELDEVEEGDAQKCFQTAKSQLKNQGVLWAEESYVGYEIMLNLLEPYVIASMSVGSDAGQIVMANSEQVSKIMSGKVKI